MFITNIKKTTCPFPPKGGSIKKLICSFLSWLGLAQSSEISVLKSVVGWQRTLGKGERYNFREQQFVVMIDAI